MTDLKSKYLAGDCQEVRDALRETINADSPPDQLAVATEVADEFVTRCIDNLSRLYDALVTVDYQFTDPPNAFVLHDSPDEESVAKFEQQMGKMPLIAARWYRRIKSVDFSQTCQQLTDNSSPLAGLGWHAPIVVQSLEQAREHWLEHCREIEEAERSLAEAGYPTGDLPSPALFTGGCASNNDCKGFDLPSFGFDDVLYNDGGGNEYFGDEIAWCFQCGGFPVLTASESTLEVVRTLYGEPDKEFLLQHLPTNYQEV